MGGNIPGGNFLGGNFPGVDFPGESLMGGNFSGGDFPRTLGNNHDGIAVTTNVPDDKHSLILHISAQI